VCVSWSRRTLMNTKAACRWLCPVSAGLAWCCFFLLCVCVLCVCVCV
jgi:hypothetical protein